MAEGSRQAAGAAPTAARQAPAPRQALARAAAPRLVLARPGQAAARSVGARAGRAVSGASPAPSRSPRRRERDEAGPAGRVLAAAIDGQRGKGMPLPAPARTMLAGALGMELGDVRLHTDQGADRLARSVGAVAFTSGRDIFFRHGAYDPSSRRGLRLLAHEVTHTAQHASGLADHRPASDGMAVSSPADGLEQAAKSTADYVVDHVTELRSATRIPLAPAHQAPAHEVPRASRLMLQRDVASEADPWDKLSPSVRKAAEDLHDDCDGSIWYLDEAQMVLKSSLRDAWLGFLRRLLARIEALDSDGKFAGLKNTYTDFISNLDRNVAQFSQEWAKLEERCLFEYRSLLSMKSTDATEAAKYLYDIYLHTKGPIQSFFPFPVTDDDYLVLKRALDKQEHIRIGMLRGTRIRAQELLQMMRTVADLRRRGEEAEKFIPGWSERVTEEAGYLESFAALARGEGLAYATELGDLRRQLLTEQQETLKVEVHRESVLEKGVALVTGAVEAVANIFAEAAKETLDLAQIGLHVVTFGKYDPTFTSDMAKAAEHGATTTDLLKGMVTGMIDTPSRFLKACRDGDWEAIGRESVQLYFLAKTIKAAPELIKGSAEALRRLPDALAKTLDSLRILRERTVALGLRTESRFMPEPRTRQAPTPTPAPKPPPAPAVKQGPGMLRDVDSPSRSVQVHASHPVLKGKVAANDPHPPSPQGQAQRIAVNAPRDVPPGQSIDRPQGPSAPSRSTDPARMGKKPPTSPPREKGFKSQYSNKDIAEIRAEQTEKVSEGHRALGEETENVHPKRLQAVDQYHHLLVQQLRRWFKSKGIDIDKYTLRLSADEHRWIHNEYRWNELWKDFRKANPGASADEIFAEMRRLQAQVGLEGIELVPYPR